MRALTLAATIVSLMCLGGLAGCEKGAAEDAGEQVDDAVDAAGDAMKDAGDAVKDATN